MTLVAQFVDKNTNATLGSDTIKFAGGNWTKLNFSFTTTAGTECLEGPFKFQLRAFTYLLLFPPDCEV